MFEVPILQRVLLHVRVTAIIFHGDYSVPELDDGGLDRLGRVFECTMLYIAVNVLLFVPRLLQLSEVALWSEVDLLEV